MGKIVYCFISISGHTAVNVKILYLVLTQNQCDQIGRKVSKSLIFHVKSLLRATFIDIWRLLSGHTAQNWPFLLVSSRRKSFCKIARTMERSTHCAEKSANTVKCFFKKRWANPGLFFVYFWSFQTNNIIFTTNQCERMSCPSGIWHWDLNPQPLKHESSPITTRPGLPPNTVMFGYCSAYLKYYLWLK